MWKRGDKPLIVLSHGTKEPSWSPEDTMRWEQSQVRLATMSTNSARIVAERSGHVIQWGVDVEARPRRGPASREDPGLLARTRRAADGLTAGDARGLGHAILSPEHLLAHEHRGTPNAPQEREQRVGGG